MPSFENMQKHYSSTIIGEQFKESADMVMNETFANSTTYRKGKLYNCYMSEIYKDNEPVELEFRFLKIKTYTIEKDQVEYMIQFRPGINPEIIFDDSSDQKHRLGYYIDIQDDNTKLIEKWIIVGKDKGDFDRYNVLKCNWLFEWLDKDKKYRKCLGCVRDRNNYNSGIWNDGFVTSIENQTSFIVPTNDFIRELDYGKRFMITDNTIHPKTYEITKAMDTFPLGISKFILSQTHYNEHTDFCGVDEEFFNDSNIHMICNFIESSIKPTKSDIEISEEITNSSLTWKLSKVNNKLHVNGQPQIIKAIPNIENINENCKWHILIDNEDYTDRLSELSSYFDISIDKNMFTIAAINKDLIKYIVTIKIYDEYKTYYDFVEMEVVA